MLMCHSHCTVESFMTPLIHIYRKHTEPVNVDVELEAASEPAAPAAELLDPVVPSSSSLP